MHAFNAILYALHGFLGQPSDWKALLHEHDLQGILQAVDIFNSYPIKSLSQWAQSFNKTVELRRKNKKTPHLLMGYSLGGRLALHALIQKPLLWDAAVIVSTHPGLSSEKERSQKLISDEKWAGRFQNEAWDVLMGDWNGQSLFYNDPFKFERKEEDHSRKVLANVLRNFSLARQDNLIPSLANLNLPILWIAGEKDFPYAMQAKKLSFKHPISRIEIIPDAGHRLPWQIPQQFLTLLIQFLTLVEQKL